MLISAPVIVAPAPLIAVTVGPAKACTAVAFKAKRRKGRRTEAECLLDEWASLRYYRGMKWEPLFDDFGMVEEGRRRHSRRLYLNKLLK